LVTNGDFSGSDLSSFVPYNSGTLGASVAIVGGELKITNTGTSSYAFARVIIPATVGQQFTVRCDLKNGNASYVHLKPHSGCTFNPSEKQTSSTSYESTTHTVTATSTSVQFRLQLVGANGTYVYFDNVSVVLADADRSVNANGLQVNGTITKTAVATGADLVAYSGFSASNYLQQPHQSYMDDVSGDWSITHWGKVNGSVTESFWEISQLGTDQVGDGSFLSLIVSGNLRFYAKGNAGSQSWQFASSNIAIGNNNWQMITYSKQGDNLYIYQDGNLTGTKALAADGRTYNEAASVLRIGNRSDSTNQPLATGSVSLFRFSKTVPTAAQIKEIYEAEKPLFQENAKATLNGTSDAVQCLAYDDSTELLHVGTSGGRSTFQGLCRVDETATNTTEISAQGGMIIEETA
jgi:hypothetical protein